MFKNKSLFDKSITLSYLLILFLPCVLAFNGSAALGSKISTINNSGAKAERFKGHIGTMKQAYPHKGSRKKIKKFRQSLVNRNNLEGGNENQMKVDAYQFLNPISDLDHRNSPRGTVGQVFKQKSTIIDPEAKPSSTTIVETTQTKTSFTASDTNTSIELMASNGLKDSYYIKPVPTNSRQPFIERSLDIQVPYQPITVSEENFDTAIKKYSVVTEADNKPHTRFKRNYLSSPTNSLAMTDEIQTLVEYVQVTKTITHYITTAPAAKGSLILRDPITITNTVFPTNPSISTTESGRLSSLIPASETETSQTYTQTTSLPTIPPLLDLIPSDRHVNDKKGDKGHDAPLDFQSLEKLIKDLILKHISEKHINKGGNDKNDESPASEQPPRYDDRSFPSESTTSLYPKPDDYESGEVKIEHEYDLQGATMSSKHKSNIAPSNSKITEIESTRVPDPGPLQAEPVNIDSSRTSFFVSSTLLISSSSSSAKTSSSTALSNSNLFKGSKSKLHLPTGTTAKEVLNQNNPPYKLSVGPQFQHHNKPSELQEVPENTYAKPKTVWIGERINEAVDDLKDKADGNRKTDLAIGETQNSINEVEHDLRNSGETEVALPSQIKQDISLPNESYDIKQIPGEDILAYLERIYPVIKELASHEQSSSGQMNTKVEQTPALNDGHSTLSYEANPVTGENPATVTPVSEAGPDSDASQSVLTFEDENYIYEFIYENEGQQSQSREISKDVHSDPNLIMHMPHSIAENGSPNFANDSYYHSPGYVPPQDPSKNSTFHNHTTNPQKGNPLSSSRNYGQYPNSRKGSPLRQNQSNNNLHLFDLKGIESIATKPSSRFSSYIAAIILIIYSIVWL